MFGGLWWIIGVVAAVWVLVDVWTKRKGMDQTQKIVWTIAAIIFSVITAIVYYFVVYSKK
jgi:prolipoprotein diacylglyceryltransferase